jgi:hypothetical protein
MSFYIQFLCDNFAQKYSQNAGFGIFTFKILWEGPWIPLPTQKEGQTPTPSRRFITPAKAFGCWTNVDIASKNYTLVALWATKAF